MLGVTCWAWGLGISCPLESATQLFFDPIPTSVYIKLSMENEQCSICWRDFSRTVLPYCIPCGHSLCLECCRGLRKCPLCRARLPLGYEPSTNYSLLSLIDKQATSKPATANMGTQTEKRRALRKDATSNPALPSDSPATSCQTLRVKLTKNLVGAITKLELSFK